MPAAPGAHPGERILTPLAPRRPEAGATPPRGRRPPRRGGPPRSPPRGAADVGPHNGPHPPHEGEHAAIETASSRGLMISGTPARHPAPATRSRLFHGLDDI